MGLLPGFVEEDAGTWVVLIYIRTCTTVQATPVSMQVPTMSVQTIKPIVYTVVCYQVACKLYILVHLWIHNMMIKYKTDLCTSFCSLFDTTLYGGFDLNKICGTIFDSFTRNLSKNRWYLVFPVSVTCGTRRLVVHGSDGGRNISKSWQMIKQL